MSSVPFHACSILVKIFHTHHPTTCQKPKHFTSPGPGCYNNFTSSKYIHNSCNINNNDKKTLLTPTEAALPLQLSLYPPSQYTSSKSILSFALVATSPFVRIFNHIDDTTTNRPLAEVTPGINSVTRGISHYKNS